ncbi:hypothetical protein, variant [Verruconis gallopava]|uniref:Uncharacterized protein n=1 Tax=Verruconis gallopava TaxID=253628 RepID=A0A0D1Z3E7_9PEZI|nr:uncharacterized protein PV09_01431 [Verruconis gallopava]XP_016217331.1 hypothetical protein, variant [Verruconis gallopava]KIW07461.1 hypothetical protein PV09_01431 [Verruconis gallopava]KIW07462.1 hypothetical protein, variant [Verruconis gallopava]
MSPSPWQSLYAVLPVGSTTSALRARGLPLPRTPPRLARRASLPMTRTRPPRRAGSGLLFFLDSPSYHPCQILVELSPVLGVGPTPRGGGGLRRHVLPEVAMSREPRQ